MNKAAASTTTSARDVMTRVEGMVVAIGVGEVVSVVEVAMVVGQGRVVEVVKGVGLVVMVGVGMGAQEVRAPEPLINCSLLHGEQRLKA